MQDAKDESRSNGLRLTSDNGKMAASSIWRRDHREQSNFRDRIVMQWRWCRRSESNRHGKLLPTVFETAASTIPPLRQVVCYSARRHRKRSGAHSQTDCEPFGRLSVDCTIPKTCRLRIRAMVPPHWSATTSIAKQAPQRWDGMERTAEISVRHEHHRPHRAASAE